MNVKRFTGRTAREALALVKQAFGDDAVVLSTKPCDEGVEVLAMAPESVRQIERVSAQGSRPSAEGGRAPAPRPVASTAAPAPAQAPQPDTPPPAMSTLSFQDYVRNRMLRRRQAALRAEAEAESRFGPGAGDSRFADSRFIEPHFDETAVPPVSPRPAAVAPAPTLPAASVPAASVQPMAAARERRPGDPQRQLALAERIALRDAIESGAAQRAALADDARATLAADLRASGLLGDPPVLRDTVAAAARTPAAPMPSLADARPPAMQPGPVAAAAAGIGRREHDETLRELRAMKQLIEERFGALAFMEKLQKQPRQALLTQRLLDCGFSPALVRKLADSLSPAVADEMAWVAGVLERNLASGEAEPALEDQGGVVALIGATGVGKTTSTAKLAAAFATRHGAGQLGLITLDAYRMGAHEQLRAYGRILGVSVHTAHDRASLEDLLDLLSGKRMVLIDTAGMAQRDSRTAELLDMLGHPSIRRLLVINAAAQGETTEDVMTAYRAGQCCGVVLSKVDEAVKLAPALDALIRHRVKVLAVANGQRVPEDWHRLSAQALVQRALKAPVGGAYRHDPQDVTLVFTAAPSAGRAAPAMTVARPSSSAGSVAVRRADDDARR
jgi:flagellar biosynthesis protein FlhF